MRRASAGQIVAAACLAFAVLAMPSLAFADMGPPALFLEAGATAILLVEAVVILVETPILQRLLKLTWRRALLASLAANALSALVGLPLAFIGGNWLSNRTLVGTLLGDWVILFVPVLVSFVSSSVIEWPVVKVVAGRSWRQALVAVLVANAASHLVLGALWFAILNR